MERSDQDAIDAFVSIAGVSESVAIQKLQEHGGDLNNAIDAYFAETNENNVPVVNNVSAPRQDPTQLDVMDRIGPHALEHPRLSASGILDRLFGTNNPIRRFHEPTFFPSREIDENRFTRSIFDRVPIFPGREPFVSHPREVREIPIEVKDSSNVSSSSPRHAPTIVDVTETEHDHGPGISGVVTMDDDDYASENDMPSRTTQVGYASDNDVPARSAQTEYLDDDIEEQMLLAAIEASRRDAEEKQSAKSFETGMDLVEDAEDVEERPLSRQKTKSLSSSFKELPTEVAESAPLSFSSTTDQDQNTIYPYVPHEELERQQASLPQEPLPDEDNVVNLLIRMSDGRRLSRRFLKSDKLKTVFDFIQLCGGVHPGSYKLARSYPRRTFSDVNGESTLEEIGITSKQEALYLETV